MFFAVLVSMANPSFLCGLLEHRGTQQLPVARANWPVSRCLLRLLIPTISPPSLLPPLSPSPHPRPPQPHWHPTSTSPANSCMAKEYRLKQLHEMTKGFDEKRCIGEGGFGKVYRGDLRQADGSTVAMAVKKLREPISKEDFHVRANGGRGAERLGTVDGMEEMGEALSRGWRGLRWGWDFHCLKPFMNGTWQAPSREVGGGRLMAVVPHTMVSGRWDAYH